MVALTLSDFDLLTLVVTLVYCWLLTLVLIFCSYWKLVLTQGVNQMVLVQMEDVDFLMLKLAWILNQWEANQTHHPREDLLSLAHLQHGLCLHS